MNPLNVSVHKLVTLNAVLQEEKYIQCLQPLQRFTHHSTTHDLFYHAKEVKDQYYSSKTQESTNGEGHVIYLISGIPKHEISIWYPT